jgi:c(7)-type cytochrome triheme protein
MRDARRFSRILLVLSLWLVLPSHGEGPRGLFKLPPLPPPEAYGDLQIDRISREHGVEPVHFSHWTHRSAYTCRVCHFELGFEMQTNLTEITESANRKGQFCGACHDGETAFGHTEEHCSKCHTGPPQDRRKAFKQFRKSLKLPAAPFGNRIDWVEARSRGLIQPQNSLFEPDFEPLPFNTEFEVPAAWALIPPADFSHDVHLQWLECSNCHPDIFKIKKRATQHFLMKHILEGKFCGACHMKVAFPLDNCQGCHPDMRK